MDKTLKSSKEEVIKLNRRAIQDLYRVIIKLKTPEQAEEFLKDTMSSAEILEFARRLLAARLLYRGKTYRDIEAMIGMSPITVNKIHFKTKGSPGLRKLLS